MTNQVDALQPRRADWLLAPVSVSSAAALLLLFAGLWLFTTPYAGLSHDAQAYAFQAIARMDPDGLGQDVFLRYQSQDRFTVFPSLYGALAVRFGVEPTAAALTLVMQAAWLVGEFSLMRQLTGARLAFLALGLLITVPGGYGGQRVFHFAEPFLTARLPAEVACLFAIWAFFAGRRFLCCLLLALGLVLHPLMAFPAVIFVALAWLDTTRVSRFSPVAIAGAMVGGALAGSVLLGGHEAIIASNWLDILHTRSQHLFADMWTASDWNQTALTLLTLLLAIVVCGRTQRPAAVAARLALLLGVTGLALTVISSEVWPLRILVQGQPWRWLWISRFFAITLLPVTVYCAWTAGRSGRSCALLLVAAWLAVAPMASTAAAMMWIGTGLASLASVSWLIRVRIPESTQSLIERGAYAALALVLFSSLAAAALAYASPSGDPNALTLARRLTNVINVIAPAILVVAVAWFLTICEDRKAFLMPVVIVGVMLVAIGGPPSFARWTQRAYSDESRDAFADWRHAIPRTAEVFWWDGLRETWFLLERRSYLTRSQGGGVVFSEQTAKVLQQRAVNASGFINPGFWFNRAALPPGGPTLTVDALRRLCRDPELGFVVAREHLGRPAASIEWPQPDQVLYLYACKDFQVAQRTGSSLSL